MTVNVDQFIRRLEDSRIIPAEEMAEICKETTVEDGTSSTAKVLADRLVREGRLTRFQVKALLKDKTKWLVIDHYALLDKIGEGGMGQVFKAKNLNTGRIVALKGLSLKAADSRDASKRFQREIKVAAMLDHPNIVRTLDGGKDLKNHARYLVMEFIDGEDLGQLVKREGPLSVSDALYFITEAAKGLQFAHSKGVVHRDIKPSNLILTRGGQIKVADMGLARMMSSDLADEAEMDTSVTRTGTVVGSVDFMSPEQAANTKGADERSDIYSLGCSFYYLVTGRPLYVGGTFIEKLIAHREEAIPTLGMLLPSIDSEIERIFQLMVAKLPSNRFQSVTELIEALNNLTLLNDGGNTVEPVDDLLADLDEFMPTRTFISTSSTDAAADGKPNLQHAFSISQRETDHTSSNTWPPVALVWTAIAVGVSSISALVLLLLVYSSDKAEQMTDSRGAEVVSLDLPAGMPVIDEPTAKPAKKIEQTTARDSTTTNDNVSETPSKPSGTPQPEINPEETPKLAPNHKKGSTQPKDKQTAKQSTTTPKTQIKQEPSLDNVKPAVTPKHPIDGAEKKGAAVDKVLTEADKQQLFANATTYKLAFEPLGNGDSKDVKASAAFRNALQAKIVYEYESALESLGFKPSETADSTMVINFAASKSSDGAFYIFEMAPEFAVSAPSYADSPITVWSLQRAEIGRFSAGQFQRLEPNAVKIIGDNVKDLLKALKKDYRTAADNPGSPGV